MLPQIHEHGYEGNRDGRERAALTETKIGVNKAKAHAVTSAADGNLSGEGERISQEREGYNKQQCFRVRAGSDQERKESGEAYGLECPIPSRPCGLRHFRPRR